MIIMPHSRPDHRCSSQTQQTSGTPQAVAFGTDRLLYGSDYCWTPAAGVDQQIASLAAADQPDHESWRELTTRNAQRLLRRDRSRHV